MWEIRYFDKDLGHSVRYMNIGFETEKLAQEELDKINAKNHSHWNRGHFRIRAIKVTPIK